MSASLSADAVPVPGRADRDLAALEIGDRFVLAAVDQVLAHHQGRIAVARPHRALGGDDLERDAARRRVVEPGRHGAAADIELAGAERRDHLGGRVEPHHLDRDALVAEEALGVGDVIAGIAHGAGDADPHLRELGRPRRRTGPAASSSRRERLPPMPLHM